MQRTQSRVRWISAQHKQLALEHRVRFARKLRNTTRAADIRVSSTHCALECGGGGCVVVRWPLYHAHLLVLELAVLSRYFYVLDQLLSIVNLDSVRNACSISVLCVCNCTWPISSPNTRSSIFDTGYESGNVRIMNK